ncbi:MAG: hypothetical protein ACYTG0_27210 [Planctomycetota bacterium]
MSHGSRTADVRLGVSVLFLVAPLVWLVIVPSGTSGAPPEIRGLTEPYRTIDAAAAETGVIATLTVQEGEVVSQGQCLAKLDCDVLTVLLAIARHGMEAKGRLQAARAELKLKEERAQNFATAFASGHARPEELRRAKTDLAIAQAQLLAVEEELALKRLDSSMRRSNRRLSIEPCVRPSMQWCRKFTRTRGSLLLQTPPPCLRSCSWIHCWQSSPSRP